MHNPTDRCWVFSQLSFLLSCLTLEAFADTKQYDVEMTDMDMSVEPSSMGYVSGVLRSNRILFSVECKVMFKPEYRLLWSK